MKKHKILYKKMFHLFTLTLLFAFLGSACLAQGSAADLDELLGLKKTSNPYMERNSLTADLGGIGSKLAESGINYEFVYTAEIFSNLRGGLDQGTEYLDNIDFTFDFNLEQIFGWKGASAFFYVLGNNGGVPNDYANTIQGISNIATINTFKVYEFWVQQNFMDDRLSLLAGLFDLNSEFDARETSSLFINPTHGIGWDFAQSGENGPSIFPTTSLTFRLQYSFTENFSLRTAVFDGIPGDPEDPYGTVVKLDKDDGLLFATELAYETGDTEEMDQSFGRYVLGYWTYTSKFEEISGGAKSSGNFGIYGFAEKFLYSKSDTGQGLAAFARVGYANDKYNFIDLGISGGLVYYGLFDSRPDDVTGLAFAWVHKNNKVMDEVGEDYELNIELTHSTDILPWLNIQPNIQYVINPGIDGMYNNCFVIGSRFSINI